MFNVNVDLLGHNAAQGPIANLLMQSGRLDVGRMRPFIETNKKSRFFGQTVVSVYNDGDPKDPASYANLPTMYAGTLRRDEWKQLDEVLVPLREKRIGGVAEIKARGLTYNLGNAMGTTVLEYHSISNAMEADLTMDGVTRSMGDRPAFETHYLPIPIIHCDFELNLRALEASRRLGNPLDTTDLERAARKCYEKLENMTFTNTSYAYGGGTIYSLVNHPNRNTVTLDKTWSSSATTGTMMVEDVLELKQAAINALSFGPWMLFVPMTYSTALDEDYDVTTPGTTVLERIKKIDGIIGVKVVDHLATSNILLVQMTSDVVRIVNGMDLTVIEWPEEGGMVRKYKVMLIQVPQIRADFYGGSGIVHMA